MPVTDEERRERLVAAAAYAEQAPWDLQPSAITSRPRRANRLALVGAGSRKPRRRPALAQVAAVIFALLVVAAGAVFAVSRTSAPPRPASSGPQLQLVYRPVGTASAAALQQDARVMQERAGALGIAHATATVTGNDILLDVPTGTNTQALDVIVSNGNLSFRPVLCGAPQYELRGTSPGPLLPTSAPSTCPAANLYTAADYNHADESFSPPAPWQELQSYPSTPAADDNPAEPVLLDGTNTGYAPRLLLGPAGATGDIVQSATAELDTTDQWAVMVTFTPSGTHVFDALAARSYHTLVANEFGGTIEDAPLILATHYDTGIQIQRGGLDGFTAQQAKDFAVEIGHGALPLPLHLVSTNSLSPA
jgi:preprotein translocase subunit SecD